jgi:hypothetical protein
MAASPVYLIWLVFTLCHILSLMTVICIITMLSEGIGVDGIIANIILPRYY